MSSVLVNTERRSDWLARAADFAELTRPRLASLVLVTVAVAAAVARWGQPNVLALLHAVLGTGCVAAGASAVNQWLERHRDRLMPRTAGRPLPTGRVSPAEALAFGGALLTAGLAWLVLGVGVVPAAWALASFVIYVALYTPLKTRSPVNTAVGAVSGALPVVVGWTATGGAYDLRLASLFGLLFLWQFPHFMAIAWLYRKQYSAAGMQMLTVVDPTGRRAGVQAVLGAMAILPVSLLPGLVSPGARLYVLAAFVLGLVQLVAALRFWRDMNDTAARRLLRTTLLYLPLLLAMLLFVPLV